MELSRCTSPSALGIDSFAAAFRSVPFVPIGILQSLDTLLCKQ